MPFSFAAIDRSVIATQRTHRARAQGAL